MQHSLDGLLLYCFLPHCYLNTWVNFSGRADLFWLYVYWNFDRIFWGETSATATWILVVCCMGGLWTSWTHGGSSDYLLRGMFWNAPSVGIAPQRSLLEKSTIPRLGSPASSLGIGPVRRLWSKRRNFRDLAFPRAAGIAPEMLEKLKADQQKRGEGEEAVLSLSYTAEEQPSTIWCVDAVADRQLFHHCSTTVHMKSAIF